jgi:hypothetical protein
MSIRSKVFLCTLLVSVLVGNPAAQTKTTKKAQGKVEASAKSKVSMADADTMPVRKYSMDAALEPGFFAGNPPASCSEWATNSPPQTSATAKCKELGGKSCCSRCNTPSYDIGPSVGQAKVGEPFKAHFRIRHLGVGDYVIYGFGKVDWGDNSQQDLLPVGQDIELAHTYDTAKKFTVHVMGGAQFKYQGNGSCSYECCTDNSIDVGVTP